MPQTTIPLVGQPTQRGISTSASFTSAIDQLFINCLFNAVDSQQTQSRNVYVEKRPGIETYTTPAAGSAGVAVFVSPSTSKIISCFGTDIYADSTNCGSLDAAPNGKIKEAILNGVTIYFFCTNLGTGWFVGNDSLSVSLTFTGNRTAGSPIVTSVSSISGLYVGQLISATGFGATTRILSIDSATQVTMTENASSGAGTNTTFTRTHLAKIIDADFPSTVVGMEEMDGYIFAINGNSGSATASRIYNSDLNSIVSWQAQNYITADSITDFGTDLSRSSNQIIAFGASSIQRFINTGNSSGSILSAIKDATDFRGGGTDVAICENYTFFTGPVITNPGIWMLVGGEIKKISTPIIDRAIGTGRISAFRALGYVYLLCNPSVSSSTFLYCVELDAWLPQSFAVDVFQASGTKSPTLGVGPMFVASGTTGKIYKWDVSPVYTDDSSAYTMTIQTEPKALNGGKGFTVNAVTLLADNQASGTTALLTSADDTATYVSKGSFTMTANQKVVRRCGFYKNSCSFRLTHSDNTAWRGQAIVVDWEPAVT